MVALSSLIGARAVIQPKEKDDWQVVPNLWGAVVGRPGVKKSPALNEALKPLRQLEADEIKKWQIEHHEWTMNCKVAEFMDEAKVKKAKRAPNAASKSPEEVRALLTESVASEEPAARRFMVNDATVEKLGELMQKNEWGTLAYRDELYGLLTSLDRSGQEGSRSFYLTSYDGNQGYTFDRIGRGTVHIPRLCLAMIGGIQPGRIQEYVRGAVTGGNADDGLLQRFSMAVWPDVARAYVHVDQTPDLAARDSAWSIFNRLGELLPDDGGLPAVWRFTPSAQILFVDWLVEFEQEIRGDGLHPAMIAHLSKYRKLIPAVALVCAMCDEPDGKNLVAEEHLLRALKWCKYLRTHANRLYAAAVLPETAGAESLLRKIIDSKLGSDDPLLTSFTARQVAAKGWTGLGTVELVRNAADLLADYGWLRRGTVYAGNGGGRPSERYLINPAALPTAGQGDGEVEGNLA
jgi:putative DNA primase/helicase